MLLRRPTALLFLVRDGTVHQEPHELLHQSLHVHIAQQYFHVLHHRRELIEKVQASTSQFLVIQEQPVGDSLQRWNWNVLESIAGL